MVWLLVTTHFWALLLATVAVLADRNITIEDTDRRIVYTPAAEWRRQATSGVVATLCWDGDVDSEASFTISGVNRIRMNYLVSEEEDRPVRIRINDDAPLDLEASQQRSTWTSEALDVGTTYTVSLIKRTGPAVGWIALDSFILTVPDDATITPEPRTSSGSTLREGTSSLTSSSRTSSSSSSSATNSTIYIHRTTTSRTMTTTSFPEYGSSTSSNSTTSPTAAPIAPLAAPTTLEAGTIAGIAVGSAVGTVFILVGLFYLWRKKREREDEAREKEIAEKQLADLNGAMAAAGKGGRQSPVMSQYGYAYNPTPAPSPGPNKLMSVWEEKDDPHATLTSPPTYFAPPSRQASKRSHYLRHSELNPRSTFSPISLAVGAAAGAGAGAGAVALGARKPAPQRDLDGERHVVTPSPMWTDSVASNGTAVDSRTGMAIRSYYSEKDGMYVYGFTGGGGKEPSEDEYGGIGSLQGHGVEGTVVEEPEDSQPPSPTSPTAHDHNPPSTTPPGWISPTTGHDYGVPAGGPRFKMSRYGEEDHAR